MALLSSRMLKLGLLGVVAATITPALFIAVRSYREEVAVFFPPRRPVALTPAASGLPRLQPVSFSAGSVELRGWYAESTNRAAVLLVHGAGGDRTALLPEAVALAEAGFGVLSFDLPGHGESGGSIEWGEPERQSLRAALDWLSRRSDVDPARLGALGFSLGGYVLVQVAAGDSRIRALVLAGTPSDPVQQAHFQHRRFGPLSTWPALYALRRGGMDLNVRGRDFVARIAPRPLLIVTGSEDATVPASMADELFRTARDPRELYVIPGAGHGGYEREAGPAYTARLIAFYRPALAAE